MASRGGRGRIARPRCGLVSCGWRIVRRPWRSETSTFTRVDATLDLLTTQDYVADRRLATAVFLAELTAAFPRRRSRRRQDRDREGARGGLGRNLVRLQCYEGRHRRCGLQWNYPRQMIEIRLAGRQPAGCAHGGGCGARQRRNVPAASGAAARARYLRCGSC
jgi:hypothetical protein